MRTALSVLSFLLAFCTTAATQPKTTVSKSKSSNVSLQSGTRYLDAIFSGYDLTEDEKYGEALNAATGDVDDLYIDVYEPSGDSETLRPAVLFVHAGGFVQGSKTQPKVVEMCEYYVERGYVTAANSYRLHTDRDSDEARVQAAEDTKAAIRWLRANATTYGIDPDRITVGGSSSGAITALYATYLEGEGSSGNPGFSSEVSAVFSLGGGLRDDDQEVQIGEAAAFLMHGDQDTIVAFDEALELEAALKNNGIPYDFRIMEGYGHSLFSSHDTEFLQWSSEFNYKYVVQMGPDGPPELTIDDVSLSEGDNGTTDMIFTVTMSETSFSGQTVTVEYFTENGSAIAGDDYVAASGTLTFPNGTTTQTISVELIGDTAGEGNETFFVNLQQPDNARITDLQGQGTIIDDENPVPPDAPSSLSATASGSSSIDLSWTDNSSNESGFKIERRSGGGGFSEIAQTNGNQTSYSDNGLSASTTYEYRVRAFNGSGESGYSNTASATTDDPPPPPTDPDNLTAAANGTDEIDLSWDDNSNDEDGFKIESRIAGTGSFAEIAEVADGVTSFTDTGLSASTTYEYRVRAFNAVGNSGYSNTASATTDDPPPPPIDPDNLTAATNGTDEIDLSWDDNSNDEDGFKIESRIAGTGSFAEIAEVAGDVTSFTDTGLSASTTYEYRVRAFNVVGNSGYSNTASATTDDPPPPPSAPDNLTANASGTDEIDLAWDDNSNNEDGFKIERRESGGGSFAEIAEVADGVTDYSDTGLSPSTTYEYRVHAFNGAGNSGYSNIADATTDDLPSPPSAPDNLTANASGTDEIDLAWDDNSSNEDGFKIERRESGGGAFAEIAEVADGVTDYSDTGLSASTTYEYRVQAFNSAGNSGYSNIADATTDDPPPPPADPSGLTATANGASQIDLSWSDNSNNEDEFKIERHSGDGNFTEIATVGANVESYDDTGLSVSTTYTYRVLAGNGSGDSDYSNEASATTDELTIDPNDNLALDKPVATSSELSARPAENAVDGDEGSVFGTESDGEQWLRVDLTDALPIGRVIVKWTSDYFATDYEFQTSDDDENWATVYATDAGEAGEQEFTFSQTTASYVRLLMSSGNRTRYGINELEVYSGDAAADPPPGAPSSLSASSNGVSEIDLSWTDNSSNEDNFNIERHSGDGNFAEIATVGADVTNYNDTGLSASTTYTYRVRASNGAGNSDYSNEDSATTDTPAMPPADPSGLTATANGASEIDLSWTDNSSNEDNFKIERHAGDGNFAEIATVGADVVSYNDAGLSVSSTYTYRVRSSNSAGNSGYSSEASATTDDPPPPPADPSGLTATANGSSQIDLSWTDNSSNEDNFKIERHSGDGNFAEIATVGADVTSFGDTGLLASTTYTYRVFASNGASDSDYSNEASATTDDAPPTDCTPGENHVIGKVLTASSVEEEDGPIASANDGDVETYWESGDVTEGVPEWLHVDLEEALDVDSVAIVWESKNYATVYEIQTSLDDLNWTTAVSATKDDKGTDEHSFAAVSARYVRIYMTEFKKSSAKIGEFEVFGCAEQPTTTPAAPSGLTATTNGSSQIDLAWTDNANNETGFKIERHSGDGSFTQIASIGANATSYSNGGLSVSTTYTYRVRATNGAGDSDYSNEASATTDAPPPPPAAPSGLTATASGSPQIDLSWTDNSGNEDNFKIERHSGDGNFAEIATVGADVDSYNDAGLAASTTFTYRVRAVNSVGNSGYSNEASATTEDSGVDPNVNLAFDKPIDASNDFSSFVAENANDGDEGTVWGTKDEGNEEWLRVDLETSQTVGRAIVKWSGSRFAPDYELQVSDDDVNWTTVYATDAGDEGEDEFEFAQTTARYVRLFVLSFNSGAVAVMELEVYSGPVLGKQSAVSNEPSSVDSSQPTVDSFALHQNYPNPFNPETTIRFALPKNEIVRLTIYNAAGQAVRTLLPGVELDVGEHNYRWDGRDGYNRDVASGIYFIRIAAGQFSAVRKAMLVR